MSKNASCDDQRIMDLCEERARKGDGAFVIAFALLHLADEQSATASALRALGTADAVTPLGALEYVGGQIEKAAQAIADALVAKAAGEEANDE